MLDPERAPSTDSTAHPGEMDQCITLRCRYLSGTSQDVLCRPQTTVAEVKHELKKRIGRPVRIFFNETELTGLRPLTDFGLPCQGSDVQLVLQNSRCWVTTSSFDAKAVVWDLLSCEQRLQVTRHDANDAVMHPAGRHLFVTKANDVWEVVEVPSGRVVYSGEGGRGAVTSLACSSDGRRLMVAAEDGCAHIYDCSALNDLADGADLPQEPLLRLDKKLEQRCFIMAIGAFSQDGSKAAMSASGNRVVLWNVDAGEAPKEFKAPKVTSLSFSPDGTLLAASLRDGSVKVWNLQLDTGEGEISISQEGNEALCVAFSPDGAWLAVCYRLGPTVIFDVKDRSQRLVLGGHSSVNAVCFTPDGEHLATASDDATVKLWSLADGSLERELRGHQGGICGVRMS